MYRLLTGLALLLVLAACGSGTTKKSAEPPSTSDSASASADPGNYFRKADSDAINAAAGPTQAAIRKAIAQSHKCNRFQDYAAWRKCWHGRLDPVMAGLARTAAAMGRLAEHDLPKKCVLKLNLADHRFSLDRKAVAAHLEAIDGDDYNAQKSAVNHVVKTLQKAQKTFTSSFPPLTQACYSPADLASINASPSASAP